MAAATRGHVSHSRLALWCPMLPDLTDIFSRYEAIRREADALFSHVTGKYPAETACHKGCSDCCHALFDLSLVEAMYINRAFNDAFPHSRERSRILELASETDRKLTKAKRELYNAQKNGESAGEIMRRAAVLRMPCPLLSEDSQCALYEHRPITCRLYGIPLAIGEDSHVCGQSGFGCGQRYPTVQLGKVQGRLEELSREIARAVGSRFDLDEVYVPLSMALLTRYDDAYLGIGKAGAED